MPLIHGEEFPERNLYFFRSYENQYAAIMNGDWKLIKYHQGPSQLYNIRDDIGEAGDLIFVNPEKAELLQTELEEWEKTAVPKF